MIKKENAYAFMYTKCFLLYVILQIYGCFTISYNINSISQTTQTSFFTCKISWLPPDAAVVQYRGGAAPAGS